MSNQSKNPQTNTNETERQNSGVNRNSLTTQSLGIADSKEKDMTGFILNQKDIHSAVYKLLIAVGVDRNDVKAVKVGVDKSGKLRIFGIVSMNAFRRNKKRESFLTFNENRNDDIPRWFFDALYNKTYHGKNNDRHMTYRKHNYKGEPSIIFEIDPEIFIAFAYDIDFYNDAYEITPIDLGRTSNPKQYLKDKKNLKDFNLNPCIIMVKFMISNSQIEKAYKKLKELESQNANIDYNTFRHLVNVAMKSNPFHPKQVDEYYKIIEDYKRRQKKKQKKNY